jgi:hypothetical protein
MSLFVLLAKQIVYRPCARNFFYDLRIILYIEVHTHLILVFHEAEIPVREAMVIEPLYCLLDCHRVKMVYIKTMSNYADSVSVI